MIVSSGPSGTTALGPPETAGETRRWRCGACEEGSPLELRHPSAVAAQAHQRTTARGRTLRRRGDGRVDDGKRRRGLAEDEKEGMKVAVLTVAALPRGIVSRRGTWPSLAPSGVLAPRCLALLLPAFPAVRTLAKMSSCEPSDPLTQLSNPVLNARRAAKSQPSEAARLPLAPALQPRPATSVMPVAGSFARPSLGLAPCSHPISHAGSYAWPAVTSDDHVPSARTAERPQASTSRRCSPCARELGRVSSQDKLQTHPAVTVCVAPARCTSFAASALLRRTQGVPRWLYTNTRHRAST